MAEGFRHRAKVRWEKNQTPNLELQKIIKYEIKKDVNTIEENRGRTVFLNF
jgi:hypothetical protein